MRPPTAAPMALAALALLLSLAPGAGAPDGAAPDDGRPGRLDAVTELSCHECHAEIAEEWASSLHGLAWVDPHYRAELETRRRPEACHGCHIPRPLHRADADPEAKPPARAEEDEPLHFGVSCNTCHLGPEGEILGPWGAETDAHRSVKSPSFEGEGRNALCATCHRTTIGPVVGIARDFDSDGGKRSCVGCHMSVEYRPAAVRPDGTPSEERMGRSHRLNGPRDPEFLEGAFDLSARADGERTIVAIENAAGHRIPGLTTRRFHFDVAVLGDDGETAGEASTTVDNRAYLARDARLELPVEAVGATVLVTGRHELPGAPEPVTFLRTTLEVER